jgi:hypothetical protein
MKTGLLYHSMSHSIYHGGSADLLGGMPFSGTTITTTITTR